MHHSSFCAEQLPTVGKADFQFPLLLCVYLNVNIYHDHRNKPNVIFCVSGYKEMLFFLINRTVSAQFFKFTEALVDFLDIKISFYSYLHAYKIII